MKKRFRVMLAGNPNCGKTTIFNQLTGARQHVGNYPGVTVESKSGFFDCDGAEVELVDLPGIYSLSSSSPEEAVAFDELTSSHVDLIVNVVDSSILQRNLYLTMQLAELRIPMLLVFNMIDEAREKGFVFELAKFEHFLGCPVVETVGSRGIGMSELRQKMTALLRREESCGASLLSYGADIDEALEHLTLEISQLDFAQKMQIPPRFYAIKLLEKDASVSKIAGFALLRNSVDAELAHLRKKHAIDAETFMADRRYGLIAGVCQEAVRRNIKYRFEVSDRIDAVMINKWAGLPVFLLIMYLMFYFTFTCAEPFMGYIENLFGWLAGAVGGTWSEETMPFVRALVIDGIIGGVGGVIVFLPNILFLFLAISFLEDTGYMARAAFVMDGIMRKFGLHGKSFVPLVLGFGCSVPAIMATRSIESESDRKTTIMVLPLMSCGARLPIYALIIPAFFVEKYQAGVMWLIYAIGIVIALLAAMVMKSTLFKGDGEVYLMELPPYRMPTLKSLLLHMWDRGVMYLQKAGSIILLASIILFVANTFPKKTELSRDYAAETTKIEQNTQLSDDQKKAAVEQLGFDKQSEMMEYTVSGRVGKALQVVFAPLGFDWRISTASIGALAAKEVFVSQLGILFSVGAADEESVPLREHLARTYTPLQGFCMMLFSLLSIPCLATLAVIRRELNSWKMAVVEAAGLLTLAYVVTLVVYQTGLLLKIGTTLAG